MVQQIEARCIQIGAKVNNTFRCNKCHAMFSSVTTFIKWEYNFITPKYCPNCGKKFTNGGKDF